MALLVKRGANPLRYSAWALPWRKTQDLWPRMSLAIGTIHGSAYAGDLKTLWARSRSDARTTNLQYGWKVRHDVGSASNRSKSGGTYLWKTETQLRGPLAHWARYASNFGCNACIKGPVSGILKQGPGMEPFR